MAIYYLAFGLSMFFAWLCMHMKSYVKKRKIGYAVFFSAMPLFLVAALRYGIGADYFSYIHIFQLAEIGIFPKIEFLFNFTNLAIAYVGLSEQWFFIVCAALFCFFTYRAIFEESPYPVLSVFLLLGMYFFLASLNIVRQMVGASILLFGIKFIISGELKKYVLCVIAAFGFHFSCILFLPFYWLRNFKMTRKKVIFLSILVVAALSTNILDNIIFNIMPLFNVEHYIGSKYDDGKVGYIYMIIQLGIDALVWWQYRDNVKYNTYFNIQLINTWISFLLGRVPLISRFRYLFGFPCIILLPLALAHVENKGLRQALTVSVFIFYLLYIHLADKTNTGVLPYASVLDF